MHIPTAPSQQTSVLCFHEALSANSQEGNQNCPGWIYVPACYSEYRYILGTCGENPLICIGINPSTAAPNALDNTLMSVARIAQGNGHDSWIMFNVYAQRATRPNDMDAQCNDLLHCENMKAFEHVLSDAGRKQIPVIWAAWGTLIEKRPYLATCLRDMADIGARHGARWVTAGKRSAKGHPHHPLYLRKDSPVEPFDISGYLHTLD